MKKLLLVILSIVFTLSITMFAVGCSSKPGEPSHTHDYSTTYSYDENLHWLECSCGEKKDVEAHKGGEATTTQKAVCEVCNNEYGKLVTRGLSFTLINGKEYKVGLYTGGDVDVYIPATYKGLPVTSIGKKAFANCKSVTSIYIPSSVTSIDTEAFDDCRSLKEIEIPASVTHIGDGAFGVCISLKSIEIPASVINIGAGAFHSCSSLQKIIVAEGNTKYKDIDGNLYTKDGKTLVQYAIGKTETTFKIPNSVTTIGAEAFCSRPKLKSIEIPNSLITIEDRAFYYCELLETIKIPSSVTSIGIEAFGDCESLLSVTFEEGSQLKSIGVRAFSYCYRMQEIEIPSSVEVIDDEVFENCNSLQYNVKDGLKYLGNNENKYLYLAGVVDKRNITSATIDSNCKFIGYYAFYWCESLKSIEIPNGVKSIGSYAFKECESLQSIEIPTSVTSIAWNAFNACFALKYNVKGGLKYLGNKDNKYLFLFGAESKNITTATVDSNCKVICEGAFYECHSLQSVIFEEGSQLITIGSSAFEYCTSLQSIKIPKSVTSIGSEVFFNCYLLENIYCEAESQPEGWDSDWNFYCPAQVVWGYKV